MKIIISKLFILIALIAFFIAILVINYSIDDDNNSKIKIGYILPGPISEDGWNKQHFQGISKACQELGIELLYKDNIPEFSGKLIPTIHELIDHKVDIIILNSFSYSQEAQDFIQHTPNTRFLQNAQWLHLRNTHGYFARLYQAKYLAGILAALKSKSNHYGFIAAFDIPEVNRGISAFTLGVQSIKPNAKVYIKYTNSWNDPETERKYTQQLIKKYNIDVVTYHSNLGSAIIDTAEENNIYSISYHHLFENKSSKYLGAIQANWDKVYNVVIRKYINNKNLEGKDFTWVGIDEDAVSLNISSPEITTKEINIINQAKNEIINGKDVFFGKIIDNNNKTKSRDNESISDIQLWENFAWLVKGTYIDVD